MGEKHDRVTKLRVTGERIPAWILGWIGVDPMFPYTKKCNQNPSNDFILLNTSIRIYKFKYACMLYLDIVAHTGYGKHSGTIQSQEALTGFLNKV